ncbi:Aste57867_16115 [Aphanomyces stellatus]|uniref:Aste57867_16115 protein n=1 Tax=Aphanomyces stellatus TaxID=120398 RepID=A0A485L625_9STRA|nr:hypothetical protein As57867_016059 [Aphanomyces stellatus]VFT92898.1 Aste57867_16115 [Aphanomyces stellatus]
MVSARLLVSSTLFACAAASVQQCAVEENVDYFGSDISTTTRPTPDNCCTDCQKTLLCKAYTWANGVCYLKSKQGKPSRLLGALSGVVSTKSMCSAAKDIDYFGSDIAETAQNEASDCCEDCQATAGCKAYTWANGVCYLKSKQGKASLLLGAVSGVVSDALGPVPQPSPTPAPTMTGTCSPLEDVDFGGNDITTTYQDDATQCCADCQATKGCKVYTWVDGACYLKFKRGDSSPLPGAISGVLSNSPPTPVPTSAPSFSAIKIGASGADCLEVPAGRMEKSTQLYRAPCNGSPAQEWFWTSSQALFNPASQKCLDSSPRSDADSNVFLSECTVAWTQTWQTKNKLNLGHPTMTKCLTVDTTSAWLRDCNVGDDNQVVDLRQVTPVVPLASSFHGSIRVGANATLCLEFGANIVTAAICDKTNDKQMWRWNANAQALTNTDTALNWLVKDSTIVRKNEPESCLSFAPPVTAGQSPKFIKCDPSARTQSFMHPSST